MSKAASYGPFGDHVVEVKYSRDEISDGGFGGTFYTQTRRVTKAHASISVDARVDPTQHPEIHRLMTAFFNNRAVEVHDLPGEWLIEKVEKHQHDFGYAMRFDFDLVQAHHRQPPRVAINPLTPPEPPEKVAARKLAKRILGYDPSAPSVPEFYDVKFSPSFAQLSSSFAQLGVSMAKAASAAEQFRTQMNSFSPIMLRDEKGGKDKG